MSTSFEYNGHTVTLDDKFCFVVSGPEFENKVFNDATFQSAIEAKAAIDKRMTAAAKQSEAMRRVALSALDADGVEIIIKGINRTDSSILGSTAAKSFRGVDVFPNLAWIRDILRKRKQLCALVAALEISVYSYGLRSKRGYGRLTGNYDEFLQWLVTEFDQKAQAALAATPKTEPQS